MMQMTKRTKPLSVFLTGVLIAAIALFGAGCTDNNITSDSEIVETNKNQTATVLGEGEAEFSFSVVDQNGAETHFLIHTDQKTVGDALKELSLIDGDMGPYGMYVKTVNGITVDFDKDGKYWAFYVNGEYATSGVENTAIAPGAAYSFQVE